MNIKKLMSISGILALIQIDALLLDWPLSMLNGEALLHPAIGVMQHGQGSFLV